MKQYLILLLVLLLPIFVYANTCDNSKIVISDENVSYELMSDNTIKAGEEKEIKLKVTYQKRVDDSKYIGESTFKIRD